MAGEREHIGIEKENEYKVNEKRSENKSGYYVKQPTFGTGKPSWIKQQFGKTVASRCVGMYSFLFSSFAGRAHIGSYTENIFGFEADYLRFGNRLSAESNRESG